MRPLFLALMLVPTVLFSQDTVSGDALPDPPNTAPAAPSSEQSCEARGTVRISARYLSDFCAVAVRVTGGLHGGNTAMGIWLKPYSATVVSSRSSEAARIVTGFWRAWRNMNSRGVRVEVYGGSTHLATVRGVGSPNVIWR